MKRIEIKTTSILEPQIKQGGLPNNFATTIDLIEASLDIIPNGGFTPKDLRDRNRIQSVLERFKAKPELKEVEFEDADFETLKTIVANSRWIVRHKDIVDFLSIFE